jgi:hypothetical protein
MYSKTSARAAARVTRGRSRTRRTKDEEEDVVLRALASDDLDAALQAARALSHLLNDPALACLDLTPDDC